MAKIRPEDQKEGDRRRIVKAASNSMESLSQISADCGVKVSNSTRHNTARLEFAKKNLRTNWRRGLAGSVLAY